MAPHEGGIALIDGPRVGCIGMGRPRLPDGRHEFVSVRFTAADLARMRRAATMADLDMSALVRVGTIALVDEIEIDQGLKATAGLPPMLDEIDHVKRCVGCGSPATTCERDVDDTPLWFCGDCASD